jgi:hypothetical protein
MRDIYKNPMFYYVLAPILVGAWPLLVWGMYLPKAKTTLEGDKQSYADATANIIEIIDMDPGRLDIAKTTKSLGRFTYAEAVDRAVNLCRIPSKNYRLSTGNMVVSGKKESQQARVSLVDVSIVQGAKFLSIIHSMWVNLSCERLRLTMKEGVPDTWDMDVTFKYDF